MKPKQIVILGAGISGLATAWYLKLSLGLQVRLAILEQSGRAGGWIETIEKDGFLFEQGPRSCRTQGLGRATLALIESLGLEEQVIFPSVDADSRFIYTEKGLQHVPRHLWEVPFSPLTRGWSKALCRDLLMPKRAVEDESIEDFFSRRVGAEWVEKLVDPFVSGIYAGDISRLSMKSCFPQIDQMEQKRRSLLLSSISRRKEDLYLSAFVQSASLRPMFSFKHGLETLTRALTDRLTDCLHLHKTVERLDLREDKVDIFLEDGEKFEADHVISTLPAYACSSIFRSVHPSLSKQFEELSYASVKVVNLGYRRLEIPLKGFGYLIPSYMGSPVLGCVWDSSVFPEQNHTYGEGRLTVMIGGRRHPAVEAWDDQQVIETALSALQEHCGIWSLPDAVHVRTIHQAIPQYELGYEVWKRKIFENIAPWARRLTLSGAAFTGVSINDCIAAARMVTEHRLAVH